MNKIKRIGCVSLGLIATGMLYGCGGDSNDGADVSVAEISSTSQVVTLRSGVVLAVDITYDASRVTGGETFNAVLRLPAALRFRANSAEIDGFTTVDDSGKTPVVTTCASGEQFLAFDFSRTDLLRAANPSGNGDMRLNLTADGVARSNSAEIEAAAEEQLPAFGCGEPFNADQRLVLQVQ